MTTELCMLMWSAWCLGLVQIALAATFSVARLGWAATRPASAATYRHRRSAGKCPRQFPGNLSLLAAVVLIAHLHAVTA